MLQRIKIVAVMVISVGTLAGCSHEGGSAQRNTSVANAGARQAGGHIKLCTKIPDLYGDWKLATLGKHDTDDALREHVEKERKRVEETLPDPFTPIAQAEPAERAKMKERVLWEDAAVFVLVDKFHPSPKALVIPKT